MIVLAMYSSDVEADYSHIGPRHKGASPNCPGEQVAEYNAPLKGRQAHKATIHAFHCALKLERATLIVEQCFVRKQICLAP